MIRKSQPLRFELPHHAQLNYVDQN